MPVNVKKDTKKMSGQVQCNNAKIPTSARFKVDLQSVVPTLTVLTLSAATIVPVMLVTLKIHGLLLKRPASVSNQILIESYFKFSMHIQ